jgi:hypothetical protein
MSSFPGGSHAARLLPSQWSQLWQGEVRLEERPSGMAVEASGDSNPLEDTIEDDDDNFLSGDW